MSRNRWLLAAVGLALLAWAAACGPAPSPPAATAVALESGVQPAGVERPKAVTVPPMPTAAPAQPPGAT